MAGTDAAILEYQLASGERVRLLFHNENDLDGCHISLEMYKANLGPVDRDVLCRIMDKFHGTFADLTREQSAD